MEFFLLCKKYKVMNIYAIAFLLRDNIINKSCASVIDSIMLQPHGNCHLTQITQKNLIYFHCQMGKMPLLSHRSHRYLIN